jgi:hypothetical protein
LSLLGFLEGWMNLKRMVYRYELTGSDPALVSCEVNSLLEPLHTLMLNVQVAPTPTHVRLQFECSGTRKQQSAILRALQQSGKFLTVVGIGPVQAE